MENSIENLTTEETFGKEYFACKAREILGPDAPELQEDFRYKLPERVYRNLESLVWEGDVNRPKFADSSGYEEFARSLIGLKPGYNSPEAILVNANNSYKREIGRISDFTRAETVKIVALESFEKQVSAFVSMKGEVDRRYIQIYNSSYLKQLIALNKKIKARPQNFSRAVRDATGFLNHMIFNFQNDQTITYSRLLHQRVNNLKLANPNLARVYFSKIIEECNSFLKMPRGLKSGEEKTKCIDMIVKSIVENNSIYCEILSRFEPVVEERSRYSFIEQKKGTGEHGSVILSEAPAIVPVRYNIRNVTGGEKLKHPSRIKKFAVNHFVEMVLNNPAYDNNTRERIAQRISESCWQDKYLSDDEVKSLFSKMRNFVQQGIVPKQGDIQKLLKN